MLTQITCERFAREFREIRFHAGLNAVLGYGSRSNALGKSTFLWIIDFVFGGEGYCAPESDIKEEIKDHTLDDFIERAMERIVSKNIDREKLKIEMASDWDELDKRGIQVIRDIKTILEDEGLPNDQIEWGFNFPSLSIQNAKRLRKLETTIKDIIIEMTTIKCLEEALKKLESN